MKTTTWNVRTTTWNGNLKDSKGNRVGGFVVRLFRKGKLISTKYLVML